VTAYQRIADAVRRAMQILEQEHLVERRQGAGTFAASTTLRKISILNAEFFGSISPPRLLPF